MAGPEKLTYKTAVEELERIIAEIEDGTADVDVLAEKVKRATFLIQWCKNRLKKTENEIQKVLSDIENDQDDTGEENSIQTEG